MTLTPAAAAPPEGVPDDVLDAVAAIFDDVGLGYGSVVDVADLERLAARFGINVGAVVNPEDVERLIDVGQSRSRAPSAAPPPAPAPPDASSTDAAAVFDALGIGYGRVVDDSDIRNLANRLGLNVGAVVDDADRTRVLAAGAKRAARHYPVFATVGGVRLSAPSASVDLIGYHESNHDGARGLTPVKTVLPQRTLPSRGRATHARSSADVVARPGETVRAPVTGRVIRSGTYVLYCRYRDSYAVIEPDARPGWEVKVLHVSGLRVRTGDHVQAGISPLADGPTAFPFASQIDRYSRTGWPHVHLEVVDPSIPDRPGSGC